MATAVAGKDQAARRRWRLALPDLSGGGLVLYRAVWAVTALLAIWSLALRYPDEKRQQQTDLSIYGAGLISRGGYDDGLHVAAFSSEAHRQGVEFDDLVVQVGNSAAPKDEDGVGRALAGPEGSRVTVGLSSANGMKRNVVLTRSSAYLRDAYRGSGLTYSTRRWIEFTINTTGGLLLMSVSLLLFVRRPRDPVAALISLGILFLSVDLTLLGGSSWVILQMLSWSFGIGMLFSGVLLFPNGHVGVRWWPLPMMATLAALIAAFIGHWRPSAALATPIMITVAFATVIGAVIYRYMKSEPGMLRQQMKFAVLGFVVAAIAMILYVGFDYGIRVATGEGERAWFILLRNLSNSFEVIAFAGGLLVALVRYRLYDANSAIGRSAAYGVLTLGFIALFAGVEKLAEILGERYFEHSIGIAAGAIGAAVAAACIVPLHNRVHRWAERRFQKPLIRLREGLPDYLADLRDTAPVSRIASAVMKRVEGGVRSTRAALLLRQSGKWTVAGVQGVTIKEVRAWQKDWTPARGESELDCKRRDALFPLRMRLCIEAEDDAETIGWLLLGPRPDGSFFGKDERETLAAVAAPVARAIRVAQMRQHERREISNMRSKFSRVEEALARLLNERSLDAEIA